MATINFRDSTTGEFVPVPIGATRLDQLTDTTGLSSASAGSPLVYASGSWTPASSSTELRVSRVRPTSGAALRLMDDGGNVRFRINSSAAVFFADSTINGGGKGIIGIANAETVPTASVTGAALLYSEGGVLKVRNQGTTPSPVATLAEVEELRTTVMSLQAEIAVLRGA